MVSLVPESSVSKGIIQENRDGKMCVLRTTLFQREKNLPPFSGWELHLSSVIFNSLSIGQLRLKDSGQLCTIISFNNLSLKDWAAETRKRF